MVLIFLPQHETGPRPGLTEQLADARARLDHLRVLKEQREQGEFDDAAPEIAKLELSVQTLEQELEIVLREGLTVDFPLATKVIPNRLCKSLDGFGARYLTLKYSCTVRKVQETFGVDVSAGCGNRDSGADGANAVLDDALEWTADRRQETMVRV